MECNRSQDQLWIKDHPSVAQECAVSVDFDMFTLMANNHDILDQESNHTGPVITPTEDFCLSGITKFQLHIHQ
ncbi:hypothetical protein MJO28_003499, partial [Puccinia striiformis f. sp. tritici]